MRIAIMRPICGVAIAIAITTIMNTNGLIRFCALSLFPLMGVFWILERLSRQSVGFEWGRWCHYGVAVQYPILVLGAISLVAVATGAVDTSRTNWGDAWLQTATLTIITTLIVIITEEGFFRGWLWASLARSGQPPKMIVVWTSIAFSLWHLAPAVFSSELGLHNTQIPLYLVNAAVVGGVWGVLRSFSNSVIVTSVSHGLWNGMTYVLFGAGANVGALGIKNTMLFGPEVGVLGLGINTIFLVSLWWWKMRPGT